MLFVVVVLAKFIRWLLRLMSIRTYTFIGCIIFLISMLLGTKVVEPLFFLIWYTNTRYVFFLINYNTKKFKYVVPFLTKADLTKKRNSWFILFYLTPTIFTNQIYFSSKTFCSRRQMVNVLYRWSRLFYLFFFFYFSAFPWCGKIFFLFSIEIGKTVDFSYGFYSCTWDELI